MRLNDTTECTFGTACNLTCRVRGGRPPPAIRWRIDDEDFVSIDDLSQPLTGPLPAADSSFTNNHQNPSQQRPVSYQHPQQLLPLVSSSQTPHRRRFLVPASVKQRPNTAHFSGYGIIEVVTLPSKIDSTERCELFSLLLRDSFSCLILSIFKELSGWLFSEPE